MKSDDHLKLVDGRFENHFPKFAHARDRCPECALDKIASDIVVLMILITVHADVVGVTKREIDPILVQRTPFSPSSSLNAFET